MKSCSVPNCDRTYRSAGFCNLHLCRVRKYGSPYIKRNLKEASPSEELAGFFSLTDRSGVCWHWLGNRMPNGYGRFRHVFAHRFAYERLVGPIPNGLFVLHYCDNPSCVRPDHLFVGTQQDNRNDCKQKGRTAAREKNGQAKLTSLSASIIRHLEGRVPQRDLAELFGVSQRCVDFVQKGITWNIAQLEHAVMERGKK